MNAAPRHTPRRIGLHAWSAHAFYLLVGLLLLAAAFPPMGWWPLAYFALVPIGIVAVRSQRPGRLFLTAYLVFFFWWWIQLRWMSSVQWLAPPGVALVFALEAALALHVLQRLHQAYRGAMTLTLPMVWIAMEYLRGLAPMGGFGWLSLGHTQAAYLPSQNPGWIVQTADLFGEHTVGFIVAMTSGLMVDLLTRPLFKPGRTGLRRIRRTLRLSLFIWSLVFFGALFYGRNRVNETANYTTPGPTIAVIQTDVPQSNKISASAEQQAKDFVDMIELSRQAAQHEPSPDLIVWPETMVPVAVNPQAIAFFKTTQTGWYGSESYHQLIESLAHELATPLLVGAPHWSDIQPLTFPDGRTGESPRRRANSAYFYDADGTQSPSIYSKQHRVPFGEYLPIINSVGWLKQLYLDHISPYPFDYSLAPGETRTVFTLPDSDGNVVRVVTPICYEDAVGRVTRALVYEDDGSKRADIIINLTNSAWYTQGSMRPQHLQIAVFRAIENRAPIARSVNSGISGFIDSTGRIGPVVQVKGQVENVAGFAAAQVNLDSRISVYGRVGTAPIAGMTIVTAALWVGGFFRRKPGRRG